MRASTIAFLFLLSLIAACSGGGAGAPQPATSERKEVLAPIETAEIQVRESLPPQYALRVVSGLPSGCASFERIDVARPEALAERKIEVTVWNTVPADDDIACTMIYGIAENTANLGSDFESGETYEVRINGERTVTFTAQ